MKNKTTKILGGTVAEMTYRSENLKWHEKNTQDEKWNYKNIRRNCGWNKVSIWEPKMAWTLGEKTSMISAAKDSPMEDSQCFLSKKTKPAAMLLLNYQAESRKKWEFQVEERKLFIFKKGLSRKLYQKFELEDFQTRKKN